MPRRRELRGIAAGFLQKFVSRNNAIGGYWALGLFYKIAFDSDTNSFRLNLLNGESQPEYSYSHALSHVYLADIVERMGRKGFSRSQLTDAHIEFRFKVNPTPEQMRGLNTWGDPYLCRVSLVDDLGRARSFSVRGWCGVHDPNREQGNICPNRLGW